MKELSCATELYRIIACGLTGILDTSCRSQRDTEQGSRLAGNPRCGCVSHC